MRALLLSSVVVALGGCTALDSGVARTAGAYDESLNAAELWICRGASIGSIVRAYGRNEEAWQAWRTLCGYQGVDVPRPVPPE